MKKQDKPKGSDELENQGGKRMEYGIEIADVMQEFNGKKVLDGICAKVHSGEIFGLLGPSGAGKTTLIKIVTGQLPPTSGNARILGKDAGKLTGMDRRNLGIMMEHFGLYERFSCYDNLKLFTGIFDAPKQRINEVLEAVGLYEARKTLVINLSKGMRNRLLLARVLLSNPKVLFLDEPTSGLDPATQEEIHGLIQREKEKGTTIFLTTHNMVEAEKLCDHIALLNEGKIVEYGVPLELCRKYHHQKKIRVHLYDGQDIELDIDKDAAKMIGSFLEQGRLETIHSTEPNLEMVFMELTGRKLTK